MDRGLIDISDDSLPSNTQRNRQLPKAFFPKQVRPPATGPSTKPRSMGNNPSIQSLRRSFGQTAGTPNEPIDVDAAESKIVIELASSDDEVQVHSHQPIECPPPKPRRDPGSPASPSPKAISKAPPSKSPALSSLDLAQHKDMGGSKSTYTNLRASNSHSDTHDESPSIRPGEAVRSASKPATDPLINKRKREDAFDFPAAKKVKRASGLPPTNGTAPSQPHNQLLRSFTSRALSKSPSMKSAGHVNNTKSLSARAPASSGGTPQLSMKKPLTGLGHTVVKNKVTNRKLITEVSPPPPSHTDSRTSYASPDAPDQGHNARQKTFADFAKTKDTLNDSCQSKLFRKKQRKSLSTEDHRTVAKAMDTTGVNGLSKPAHFPDSEVGLTKRRPLDDGLRSSPLRSSHQGSMISPAIDSWTNMPELASPVNGESQHVDSSELPLASQTVERTSPASTSSHRSVSAKEKDSRKPHISPSSLDFWKPTKNARVAAPTILESEQSAGAERDELPTPPSEKTVSTNGCSPADAAALASILKNVSKGSKQNHVTDDAFLKQEMLLPVPRPATSSVLATGSNSLRGELRPPFPKTNPERHLRAEVASPQALPVTKDVPMPSIKDGPVMHDAIDIDSVDDNFLSLGSVQTLLRKHLKDMHEDFGALTKNHLMRARLFGHDKGPEASQISHKPLYKPLTKMNGMLGIKQRSPFQRLLPQEKPTTGKSQKDMVQFSVEAFTPSGLLVKGQKMAYFEAPQTTWQDKSEEVPLYTHYISLKHNMLAFNQKQLHVYPYFGEGITDETLEEVERFYDADVVNRDHKLLRSERSKAYIPYVESFLAELGCTMADVLYYLLKPDSEVGRETCRALSCQEDFDRNTSRWQRVLVRLNEPSSEVLKKASLACTAFIHLAKFSLWHIVRKSDYARLPTTHGTELRAIEKLNKIACRVCHTHDCPYHGAFSERRSSVSSNDSDSSSDATEDAIDIDWPPEINFKKHVSVQKPLCSDSDDDSAASNINLDIFDTKDKHNYQALIKSVIAKQNDGLEPFYPCYHPGATCSEASCACYENGMFCEKSCGCSSQCHRRYQGCSCLSHKAGGRKNVCSPDDRCDCYRLSRECDPDLCDSCGADLVLDGENRYDEQLQKENCHNVSMQLGVPKRTLLGKSKIHGFGLYAGEIVKRNEFVGEYRGEVVTAAETERRGVVYDVQKLSYLFTLERDQEVDSTLAGNKMRFINHASKEGAYNIYVNIRTCNGVHRIGMYAQRDIQVGEELYFNYGTLYHEYMVSNSVVVKKSNFKGPHVRNQALVQEFMEPGASGSEDGRAIRQPTGKGKAAAVRALKRGSAQKVRRASGKRTARLDSLAKTFKSTAEAAPSRPSTASSPLRIPDADEDTDMKDEESFAEDEGSAEEDDGEEGAEVEEESDFEMESEPEQRPKRSTRRKGLSTRGSLRSLAAGESEDETDDKGDSRTGNPQGLKRGRGRPRKYRRDDIE